MTLTTDTLARVAFEAAAASLMETRDWDEAPTWEMAETWYPGTCVAYHAAVRAVVEALAKEAEAHASHLKANRYDLDMSWRAALHREAAFDEAADWLRGIVAGEDGDGVS